MERGCHIPMAALHKRALHGVQQARQRQQKQQPHHHGTMAAMAHQCTCCWLKGSSTRRRCAPHTALSSALPLNRLSLEVTTTRSTSGVYSHGLPPAFSRPHCRPNGNRTRTHAAAVTTLQPHPPPSLVQLPEEI
jgi:hypothetical protein